MLTLALLVLSQLSARDTPVVVFARDLPAGAILAETDFAQRKVPAELASAASLVVGQKLLVPLHAGDPIRFPQLAGFATEPRCAWWKEQSGNAYESAPPPEVKSIACPGGGKKTSGPIEADHFPEKPGYV